MYFLNFCGHEKTSDIFLNKIKKISHSSDKLLDNLHSLGIYDAITPVGNKISLSEGSNSINLKLNSNGGKCLSALFPNIFGNGESISIDYNTSNNYIMGLTIPYVSSKKLYNTKIELSKRTKEINNKNINTKQLELSIDSKGNLFKLGLEKINKLLVFYHQYDIDLMKCLFKIKTGISLSDKKMPFLKIIGIKDYRVDFNPFFVSLKVAIGRLFGKTSFSENFFIGPEVKGYKNMSIGPHNKNLKIGGKSFGLINSRIGLCIKNIELFVFGDIGVDTVKGLRECYELIKNNDGNTCVGKSIGIGASLKNNQNICMFYSFPLTKNDEVENYGFNFNLSF